MFFFASQLRSALSPQRSLDRPLPPFFRRETPLLANSFASRHDVTESRPTQTTTRTLTTAPTATTTPRIERLPVMTLCKFYPQGTCKYGNSCRFEHPARSQPQNRFGALSGGGTGGTSSGGNQDSFPTKYGISPAAIEKDLTTEKPQWILSAYAPGKDAPDQLFGGYPREQSFEELRLHYMAGKAAGNEQQALSQAQELYQNAQQQIETALRNVQEAARFTIDGENRHPNRHDICREGTQGAPFGEFPVGRRPNPSAGAPAQANAFASGASNASSPFGGGPQQSSSLGQPPALGQRPNPFGTPAFGQPAQPASGFAQQAQQAPGFGQPSQPAASPFGQQQPAQGGPGAGPSAFGQAPQTSSAFGQPSALGAKPNPFGTPAFGQPAQPNAQPGAFGQPAQPNAPAGAFGQPSQLGQKPNPFGSNANATASSSPFATIGGGSNNAPAANPFGAPSSTQANAAPNAFSSNSTNQNNNGPSPFGQPTQPAASPFAQAPAPASNPFGAGNQQQTQEANNPFAQKAQPQTNGTFGQPASNPFGQNTSQSNAQNAASPFGQQPGASQPNPFGAAQTQQQPAAAAPTGGPYPPGSTKQHPTPESYITKTMDGRLAAFKGKPVMYKNGQPGNRAFDGTWHRIWFPNGPPGYYKDTELPPDEYDDKSKAQWEAFAQMGAFADGIMPDLPPPRECTRWDF